MKQLRLWYLNNNMRNNHCYTICVSEVKVEFGVGDKRWVVGFWERLRIGLEKNTKEIKEKLICKD